MDTFGLSFFAGAGCGGGGGGCGSMEGRRARLGEILPRRGEAGDVGLALLTEPEGGDASSSSGAGLSGGGYESWLVERLRRALAAVAVSKPKKFCASVVAKPVSGRPGVRAAMFRPTEVNRDGTDFLKLLKNKSSTLPSSNLAELYERTNETFVRSEL